MKKKLLLLLLMIALILAGSVFFFAPQPANAGSLNQASYQTPTPNVDGQIIYTVQEGDSCTRIFLLTGITIDQLIALNDLGSECSIYPGQKLVIATVAPATATLEGPQVSPTPGPLTPTPFSGTGELCVVLFEDLDGNQMRAETEFYLAGGVISVNNRMSTYSETKETVGGDPALVEPVCFEEIPEGKYNLSMGIPEGYNATTNLNLTLEVSAGDTVAVDFGAQPGSEMVNPPEPEEGNGRSPLLLIIGIMLLAGGGAFTFFFIRSRTRS
jgi:LysM repeat protein